MWEIIRPDQDAQDVFVERLKCQKRGEPLDFLCIAVEDCGPEKHNSRPLEILIAWVKAYQEVEKAGIQHRLRQMAQDVIVPRVLPASILVLVDPLPYLTAETWEEYRKRAALAESGVVLLERNVERYGRSCEGDWMQFETAVKSMLPSSPPCNAVPTFDPAQVLASAVHWQPTPPPVAAAPFGRQPAHTELPDNETLKEMFKTYIEADRNDLDY